jgi:perosamine synthetase
VNKKINIEHSAPSIDAEDIAAVSEVLQSKHLEDGLVVRHFEDDFKRHFSREYAVATNNGFAAIHLALIALNITYGDEVIIPAYSCPALLYPILLQNALPVFADIGPHSFNISAESVGKRISKKTKAIIVPHIFGFPAMIEQIMQFGIPVIEDCTQALGGKYKNRKLGTFSEISIFSFYATKMICTGDGGMILTDRHDFFETIQEYKYYGHKRSHKSIEYNYHLTNLPAALGISQFKKINSFVLKRKQIAEIYDHFFFGLNAIEIEFENKTDSIYYRYPLKVHQRDKIRTILAEKGIKTGFGVLEGLHQIIEPNQVNRCLPNTENFLANILSIPIYPSLSLDDSEIVATTISKIVKAKG